MKSRLKMCTRILPILVLVSGFLALDGWAAAPDEKDSTSAEAAAKRQGSDHGAAPAVGIDATQPDASFKGEKERQSYAMGMALASQLRKQTEVLDPATFMQGLKDAFDGSGKTLLTENEARASVGNLQSEIKKKSAALQAEILQKNKQEGEAFLAENKARDGVVTLESGLQYKILKAGDGKKPALDDTVVCNYRGTLIDGREFDSSYKRDQSATFAVNKVIKGWSEALQLMPAGSKWQLFIPSSLAYGERGAGRTIGPDATLIFEVELISIKDDSGGNPRAEGNKDSMMPDEVSVRPQRKARRAG